MKCFSFHYLQFKAPPCIFKKRTPGPGRHQQRFEHSHKHQVPPSPPLTHSRFFSRSGMQISATCTIIACKCLQPANPHPSVSCNGRSTPQTRWGMEGGGGEGVRGSVGNMDRKSRSWPSQLHPDWESGLSEPCVHVDGEGRCWRVPQRQAMQDHEKIQLLLVSVSFHGPACLNGRRWRCYSTARPTCKTRPTLDTFLACPSWRAMLATSEIRQDLCHYKPRHRQELAHTAS